MFQQYHSPELHLLLIKQLQKELRQQAENRAQAEAVMRHSRRKSLLAVMRDWFRRPAQDKQASAVESKVRHA